jgi:hypothetical protein
VETKADGPERKYTDAGEDLKPIRPFCMVIALAGTLGAVAVQAQGPTSALEQSQRGAQRDDVAVLAQTQQPSATTNGKSSVPSAPTPSVPPAPANNPNDQFGKQPKRILGIIPNYRAVSANTQLPPLSFKGYFWLATQDTFDYSNFIFVGALAGINMAGKSQPTFGQGAEGYGKYYWHAFADTGIENYMAEAIVPEVAKEDPRYYTLGKGGFPKRAGYAFSRLFITRTNSGNSTFNFSEIVGAGGAAGISNLYYPAESNPWVKTYQRWVTQVGLDGVFNLVKEFWPDINHAVFRGKY